MGRRERDECFGLPNSGAIAGIVFGILIIMWGLSTLFGWEINIMAFIVTIFGALIVAGAIYRLTRGRS
jgi:ABC-type Fe3+-siderophore transport system permease subunit